ncbi:MAG: LamG-like jellyroll fold domain-containing protein, partial [Verrucomicrobiota bacterium]
LYVYFNSDEAGAAVIEANDQVVEVGEVVPFDGTFEEVTSDGGSGNYIHFEKLSGSTLTILGRSQGISGFQIDRAEPADPSLLALPESVDFGVFDGNPGPQEATIRILNPGLTKTLNISDVSITGDAADSYTISEIPNSLASGEGIDVKITFTPSDTVGIYRGAIEITSDDAVTGLSRIPLTGQIKHANGLAAHFKMDETDGTVMTDSSGNGFHGTYNSGSGSVTLGSEALASGTAVAFAEGGDAAYAEVSAEIGFPTLAEGSYSFWVQQDEADVGSPSVLFSRSSSPANPYAVFFQATGDADVVSWTSEAANETLNSEPFMEPGEVFHIVYTYSDSNEDASADVAIYVNGELNASASGTIGYPLNTIAPFQIGATVGQFGFTGAFDDFQIYETVLTADQVAAMYADPGSVAPVVEPPSPLVGYWALDEGVGEDVADYQNPALNGILTEGSWVAGHTGADGDNAVDLSGADGGGSVVEVPALNVDFSEITVTGWVKGVATGGWTGLIQSRDGTQPIGMGFRGDSGELTYTWNDNNANTYNFQSGLAIPADEWTFIALRVTPEEGKLYMGTGGELQMAVNAIEHLEQASPSVWHFGKDNCCGTARNFDGSIDDVAIYSQALTDEQIASIFAGTSPPDVFGGGNPDIPDVLLADSIADFGGPDVDNGWTYGYINSL